MTSTQVFVADDHELVRYALRMLLDAEPDMEVIGEAADTESAIKGCQLSSPDVVLLDLRMPGEGGVEACRRIRTSCPDTSVLILTSFDDDDGVFGAMEAGANGFLLKDTPPERVVQSVRAVASGQAVFDACVATRIIGGRSGISDETDALSEREMEVLRLMARGLSNREIGRALWIGETTVKTHVSHILRKLGQRDRTKAVIAAVRVGLVTLES